MTMDWVDACLRNFENSYCMQRVVTEDHNEFLHTLSRSFAIKLTERIRPGVRLMSVTHPAFVSTDSVGNERAMTVQTHRFFMREHGLDARADELVTQFLSLVPASATKIMFYLLANPAGDKLDSRSVFMRFRCDEM